MRRRDFERIANEEIARLPAPLRERIENVEWVVRRRPTRAQIEESGIRPGSGTLLGLYVGVPLDHRGSGYGMALPDRIYLFQEPIEMSAGFDPAQVRCGVRETLLHEIAHHFGFSEREVETWEREQA